MPPSQPQAVLPGSQQQLVFAPEAGMQIIPCSQQVSDPGQQIDPAEQQVVEPAGHSTWPARHGEMQLQLSQLLGYRQLSAEHVGVQAPVSDRDSQAGQLQTCLQIEFAVRNAPDSQAAIARP